MASTELGALQDVSTETLDETVTRIVDAGDPPRIRVDLGLACLAALEEAPDPEVEKDVHLAIGIALSQLESFADACEHLDGAAALARETRDDKALAHALWLQAVAGFNLGRLDEAVECATEGLHAAENAGWDDAHWRLANVLGLTEERRGNSEAAIEAYGKARETAERVAEHSGNNEGLAVVLGNFGIAAMNLGGLDQALEIFEHALELKRAAGLTSAIPSSLANIGDVLILMDRLEEARAYHLEARELRIAQGSEMELSLSHHSLGVIHFGLNEFEEALAEFEQALEIRRRLELAPEVTATLVSMAQAYAALERDDEALASVERGLELTDQLAMRGRRLVVLESLAAVYESQGDDARALEVYREATELEREQRSTATGLRLAEFRAQYEAREKEQKIALLSRERELQELALNKQRFERNALLAGGLFVTLAGLAGWMAWASLRRALKRIQKLEQERARADNLEAIGLLAGGIAHDFNNILGGAVGNLSMLRMAAPVDDVAQELLADAHQGLEQGKQLASQLLSLAKGGVLAHEPQAIEPLLRESSSFALSGSRSKAELAIAPGLGGADVDAGQFRQLISNILINADQAMPEGGTIQVQADNVSLESGNQHGLAAGPYLRITIADHGVGIDPAIRAQVFDPYFTTKKAGSGLGLALAHAIVHRHHGAIDCRPNDGGGTVFEILVPAEPEARSVRSSADESVRTGAGRVLAMDDDPLLREFYGRALPELGYECELVSDGKAAIALVEQALRESRPFHAAILDLTIPGGMGGGETVRELLSRDPAIRAIVASGYSDDRLLENYREAGFVGVLRKPFTVAALSQAVAEAVQASHSGRD